MSIKWTQIIPDVDTTHGSPCERSSHGLSFLRKETRIILHGGENVARTPLDVSQCTWALDQKDNEGGGNNNNWTWRLIKGENTPMPPERVAHAQAVYNDSFVYIFGGRAGITMQEQAMNDLWCLDCSGPPGSETWTCVNPDLESGDSAPEARSFHKMICIGSKLYVFGGCSAHHGRLADLHEFDIPSKTWTTLGSSSLIRGRGGPNLIPFDSGKLLGVVAGFCGEESNDGHLFDIEKNKWFDEDLKYQLNGLRPRSVCISASFPSIQTSVIFGGEVDPSDKGHEGAGGFENDVVLLDETSAKYLKSIPAGKGEWPEKRGWADGASYDCGDGGRGLFIFGGLSGDDTNPKRLSDLWKLDVISR